MRVLVIMDVQNDFVSGALGSDAAQAALEVMKSCHIDVIH